MIARAEMEHLAERTTDQLSGGESQQVAIAGTLMLVPRLVVLDEPLANLDPLAAQRLLRLVRGLADEGTAVVVVEHRVEDALLAARRTACSTSMKDRARYLGGLDGFFRVADPASVKLPFRDRHGTGERANDRGARASHAGDHPGRRLIPRCRGWNGAACGRGTTIAPSSRT